MALQLQRSVTASHLAVHLPLAGAVHSALRNLPKCSSHPVSKGRPLLSWVQSRSLPQNKGRASNLFAWARQATTMASCELAPKEAPAGQDIATFAGGCFWGLELAYQRIPGVTHTSVGYTAGQDTQPDYRKVCFGKTGHAEAVQVYFKPEEVTYERLLDEFFAKVDPTTMNRQGNDMGTQYRSSIYYHNNKQKEAAEKAVAKVNEELSKSIFRRVLGTKVVTTIEPAQDYYLAEDYHQHYLEKGGQNADKGATERIRCYG